MVESSIVWLIDYLGDAFYYLGQGAKHTFDAAMSFLTGIIMLGLLAFMVFAVYRIPVMIIEVFRYEISKKKRIRANKTDDLTTDYKSDLLVERNGDDFGVE